MATKNTLIFNSSFQTEIEEANDVSTLNQASQAYHLIVWNDDVNTFDWVIQSLMEICNHSPEQAEQCALFVHHKGKYAVKRGEFDTLVPMCEGLIDRGINATID